MGELLLCREPIAAMPFYLEGISVNLYTIEELCYYIENNTYLLEKDFMCEELCTWIEKEIKRVPLADHLRELLHNHGRLSEFVLAILKDAGYCSRAEIIEICSAIEEMEEKSDFECNKIRADKLMERGKYLSSIYEYKRLLENENIAQEEKVLVGNIWHNLGTAYARLFLFEEAIGYYQKAYEYNHNEESKKELLLAYRCMNDEKGFIQHARELGLDDTAMQSLRNEFAFVQKSQEWSVFEQQLDDMQQLLKKGERKAYQKAVNQLIFQWKDDYRKICRI